MSQVKTQSTVHISEQIGAELEALLDEFEPAKTKLYGVWLNNFNQIHRALVQLIRHSDSDIQDRLMEQVYEEKLPLEKLDDLTFLESSLLKRFGVMLTKFRFGLNYVGNLRAGHTLTKEECSWMVFSYEAYWRYEDHYFISSIASSQLRGFGSPSEWTREKAKKLRRSDYIQCQEIAIEVATALLEIHRYSRIMSPAMASVRSQDIDKPVFIDFRSRLQALSASSKG